MLAELAIGLLLAGSAGERTVPCTEAIQTVAFPYAGSTRYPSQLVLETVSAPGKHLSQSSETGSPPWTMSATNTPRVSATRAPMNAIRERSNARSDGSVGRVDPL